MRTFLEKIRKPQKEQSIFTMILIMLGIILGGFLLGVLQKWMDEEVFEQRRIKHEAEYELF